MTRRCQLTGKRTRAGRSYTTRGISKKKKGIGLNITGKVKRRFQPNLVKKRVYLPSEKRYLTLQLSTSALRTIDKIGVEAAVRRMRAEGSL